MSAWVNYDSVISQLKSVGIQLDTELAIDGPRQRWKVDGRKQTPGWSQLVTEIRDDGSAWIGGCFGVWQGPEKNTQGIRWDADPAFKAISKEEQARRLAEQKKLQEEAKERDEQEKRKAAEWAGIVWHQCQPATEHEYLTRKHVEAHGARVLPAIDIATLPGIDDQRAASLQRSVGALVVPVNDTVGNIKGLQFITSKAKFLWPKHMAMASNFCLLGPMPRSGVLLLTEGFATAASLREATGYTVACVFNANNLITAAKALRKAAKSVKLLICADDDYLTEGNTGVKCARQAAAEVTRCDWVKPDFLDDAGQDRRAGRKLTDFNDLAVLTGVPLTLAHQVHAKLDALGWRDGAGAAQGAGILQQGGGDGGPTPLMKSQLTVDEAVARFWGTYGLGGKTLFDEVERRLVHRDDVMNIIPPRQWDNIKGHSAWRVARDTEIGFDPTEQDPDIRCNLFGGWPTVPKAGKCEALLGLLEYLCSNEPNGEEIYRWILKWLAYPIQNRGAKMHQALVIHGPQGTGKSRFFEAYGKIFGPYFRVLGQEALEDKFNADWAEKKLFILADEVLARQDMFHIKNRLKGFVTGDTIRVNPKNVAAHTEKNHMNIVFLSNEKMPLVIEPDDRRHLVVWVPPKLSNQYFSEVDDEIKAGGIEALHDYLLNLDLGDFKPWTHPPVTRAKADLQDLGKSSEDRFISEWIGLDVHGEHGQVIPVCPCLGTHLYKVYETWCDARGERKRPMPTFINMIKKLHGWSAAEARAGWAEDLPLTKPPGTSDDYWQRQLTSRTRKVRKMVIPSVPAQLEALAQVRANLSDDLSPHGSTRSNYQQLVVAMTPKPDDAALSDWVTQGYFAFARAAGFEESL